MVTYRKDSNQRPEGWNTGAPPHVGWWLCHAWFRYFDGVNFSFGVKENHVIYHVKRNSKKHVVVPVEAVMWSWDWPEHARVARVNPDTGEVTGSGPCPYETDGQAWPFGEVKKKSEDAPKLKKKPAGNRKVTQYVLMNNARPIYVADSLQELHDRIKAMPRISWTHYEKLRNRKKA